MHEVHKQKGKLFTTWTVHAIKSKIRDRPIGCNKKYSIPAINTCNDRGVNDLYGVKAEKKGEGEQETETAVGNCDNLTCTQRHGDLVKVSKQVVKPRRRLRSNQG